MGDDGRYGRVRADVDSQQRSSLTAPTATNPHLQTYSVELEVSYMVRDERARYRVPRKISPTPDSMKNAVEGSGTGIATALKLAE